MNQPEQIIGLLLTHCAERQRVAAYLRAAGYSVYAEAAGASLPEAWATCSAIIADVRAAQQYHDQLLTLKSGPIFLPLLIALPYAQESLQTKSNRVHFTTKSTQRAKVHILSPRTSHMALRLNARWQQWLKDGFDDVLRMPLTQAEVSARLEVLLRIRQHSQQQAQLAERRFYTLIEHISDGITLLDDQGRYLYRSASTERISGYRVEERLGQSMFEVIHPQDREMVREMFSALLQTTGSSQTLQYRSQHKDGTWLWIEVVATNLLHDPAVQSIIATFRDLTERARAEALRAQLAALVESSDDAILSQTLDGVITSWNASAERLYGYTAAEAIGRPTATLVPPERALEVPHILEQIRRGERVEHFETVRVHKDGRRIDVSVTISPINDRSGRVVAASKIARDITERTQTELALRQSEDRFAKIFRASPAALAITRLTDGCFLEINEAYQQMLGYSREEVIGRRSTELNIYVNHAERAEIVSRLHEQGAVREYEIVLRAKSGQLRAALCSMESIELGGEAYALTILYDITERKRAEAALRQSEERFAKAFSASPAALSITRLADGYFIDMNESFQSMLGYRRDELIGQSSLALNMFARPAERAEFVQRLREQGQVRNYETTVRAKSGEWRSVLLSTEMIELAGEAYLLAIMIDITDRRSAEQAVRILNAELEQRVIERTTALEAANNELEAFSYSVSHDLRAPLRAIDGFSRILLEDYSADLPADAQRYLQLVRASTQQMGRLIDELLAFARLSRQPLSKRAVAPADLVHQCLEDLDYAGRHITISIGELPVCQADSALLRQVWFNLLSNALKYTHRRAFAMIEVGSERQDGEPVYWIKDNGVGFDMRYAHKLFGVFQRLHRAEDYEGTGVGLAIVQRIIHRHGGRIWAEATIDHGATFYFTLGGELL